MADEAPSEVGAEGPEPEVYERPPPPAKPSRLDAAVETTGKVAVGCLSCVALIAAAIGGLVGLGGGALYHAFLSPEGNLYLQLAGGALVGVLAGARTVVPIEELLFEFVDEKVLGGGGKARRRRDGQGPRAD